MNYYSNGFWVAWQQASRNRIGREGFPGGGLYLTTLEDQVAPKVSVCWEAGISQHFLKQLTPKLRLLGPKSKIFISTM